jgi:DNA-binding MarR family transcriptional regulator
VACRETPACDAWHLLVQLLLKQRSHLPSIASDLDLSPAQLHVLRLMEPGEAMPMGHLARRLACDASNVTGLVDRLESRGFVRRKPSASDRRVKVLELTAHGARLRGVVIERMTSPPDALERLSPREREALVRILTRLLE